MTDFLHESEIAELDDRLLLDQHILRFNVSMEEAMAMDIVEGRSDLMDNMSDLLV